MVPPPPPAHPLRPASLARNHAFSGRSEEASSGSAAMNLDEARKLRAMTR